MSELSVSISFRWEDGHWHLATECDWKMWSVMPMEDKMDIIDSLGGEYEDGDTVIVPLLRTWDPL